MARRKKKLSLAGQLPPEMLALPDLPPNAYDPTTGLPYARARLKDPSKPHYYYSDGRDPWVLVGYKVWTMDEWRDKFKGQQPDGRNWEFFGDPIDVWEGYTDE